MAITKSPAAKPEKSVKDFLAERLTRHQLARRQRKQSA
jgi:hypothetical protein